MRVNYSTIFLMSVLVLGLASSPLILPNSENRIDANDNLQMQLGNVAFAQDGEGGTKATGTISGTEATGATGPTGTTEATGTTGTTEATGTTGTSQEEEVEDEKGEDQRKVELEVKVEDGVAEVKVKIEDKFEVGSEDGIDEILAATGLSPELIDEILTGVYLVEDEFKLQVGVEDGDSKPKVELEVKVEDGVAEVKVKIEDKFEVGSEDGIDEILAATGLSPKLIDEILTGVYLVEGEFKLQVGVEDGDSKPKVELEVKVEDGVAEVKVKIEDKFEVGSEDGIDEILAAAGLSPKLIDEILTGVYLVEGEFEIKIKVKDGVVEFEIPADRRCDPDSRMLRFCYTEIFVNIINEKAKVNVEYEGEKSRFVLHTTDEAEIISSITDLTGLGESEIREIWDLDTSYEGDELTNGMKKEAKLAAKIAKHELKAKERADEKIIKLQQKIDELEQRLQALIAKFETGAYYGPIPEPDPVTTSYSIIFDGSATSLDDDSVVADVEGEIFLETQMTGTHTSKFRITGGEILVGDTFYDFVFGKARISSSGQSGEKDSMTIIGQVMNDQGETRTIKISLNSVTPLTGDLEPVEFEIKMPRSKIAKQWSLSASGQLSLLQV